MKRDIDGMQVGQEITGVRGRWFFRAVCWLLFSAMWAPGYSARAIVFQDDSRDAPAKTEAQSSRVPPAQEEYMGRRIAQTMHYAGAEWLMRESREREEQCSLLLAQLPLRVGMTVCDMGCGNGFYSLQIAKLMGDDGHVLAVDIQPEMLRLLRERLDQEGVGNVTPILGSYHDPHLPKATVDLVLMVDVYHEFSHPAEMLAAIRTSLKPDGVIALVEFRAEDPEVPIRPLHKMSKEQIMKEFPANGFKLVDEFDKLPWQHVMYFARDEGWRGASEKNGGD